MDIPFWIPEVIKDKYTSLHFELDSDNDRAIIDRALKSEDLEADYYTNNLIDDAVWNILIFSKNLRDTWVEIQDTLIDGSPKLGDEGLAVFPFSCVGALDFYPAQRVTKSKKDRDLTNIATQAIKLSRDIKSNVFIHHFRADDYGVSESLTEALKAMDGLSSLLAGRDSKTEGLVIGTPLISDALIELANFAEKLKKSNPVLISPGAKHSRLNYFIEIMRKELSKLCNESLDQDKVIAGLATAIFGEEITKKMVAGKEDKNSAKVKKGNIE